MTDLAVAPLAEHDRIPTLYEALGATIHLEKLTLDDGALLDEVNALALEWLGPHLKHTWAPFFADIVPFEPSHLGYIPGQLDFLRDVKGSALRGARLGKLHDFGVFVNGAEHPEAASPFSYRFWMEISQAEPYGVLQVTVPVGWALDDFEKGVGAMLERLRVRWASLGYTYSTWEGERSTDAPTKLAAHARRHVGFDVGFFVGDVGAFYRKIRTVNWLTVLGEAMEAEWRAAGPVDLDVERVGPHALVRASEKPERGDRNRLDYPAGYQRVDAALRPVRAVESDARWLGPWDRVSQREWLTRLERRVT